MTLDEVSSLRHKSLRHGTFTEFDFVAGDIQQQRFRVPGHQDVRPGMRITAVLREPGNWQTLQAWRFDEANKVVMAVWPAAGWMSVCLSCLGTVTLLWLLLLEPEKLHMPRVVFAFMTFAMMSYLGGLYIESRNSAAVTKLLAGTPR